MNNKNNTISLSRPDITDVEIESVVEVLRTPYLSLGPKVSEFEEKVAEYIGTKQAIAVSSGTAGLHLSIRSLGIGPDDAVITTPFSFISSANCILFERARPIFVDVEESTFNIDPEKIAEYIRQECRADRLTGVLVDRKSGRRIKAILPVHVFGRPCEMDRILQLAEEFNLYIIEDACEAIGAKYYGKNVGTFGKMSVFAFYPNKQITTGEGGIIVTDDDEIAFLCRSLRNQGRDDGGQLIHNRLGHNYRLSDINCALGIAQLERIEEIFKEREFVAREYNEQLKHIIKVPESSPNVEISWFVYVVCLPEDISGELRDGILSELKRIGIGCNNYFSPIHLQPFYQKEFGYKRGDFPITESISERTIVLPFYNKLTANEIRYIAKNLKEILIRNNVPFISENHVAVPVD